MSNTTVVTANQVEQWNDDFYFEYVRANQFMQLMGSGENDIIQLVEDLTKKAGDRITVSLLRKLTGDGVTGSTSLEGNEETLLNYGHQLTVDMLRNGVRLHKMEEQKTVLDLRNGAKTALKLWAMSKLRDHIIRALYSPVVDGKTAYASASEAQKDAWLAANSDRVLFGATKSNNAANDHSAALAQIDNTADKLTPSNISLMKRMLKLGTNGGVRPVTVDRKGETFVLLTGTYPFRDLKNNSTYATHLQQALDRGKDNPLFTDGDLFWDGVIIKEVPEIPVISNGTIDCSANFMVGAQACAVAWAQRTQTKVEMFDYEVEYGTAIEEIRGIEKLMFNSIQHGMGTLYTAAVADT